MTRRSSKKPVVFISHYAKEQEVALALQRVLTRSLLGAAEVFVSSDDTSITMGADFDPAIREALGRAVYGLCLFSPESLRRPWINIEFGALWYAGKPAVPMCFGGQDVAQLPPPYGNKNGLNATNISALNKLIANIAQALDLTTPTVDWSEFVRSVEALNARAANPWAGTDEQRTLFMAVYQQLYDPAEQEPHCPYFEQGSVQDWSGHLSLPVEQVKNAAEVLTDDGLLDAIIGFGDVFARLDTTQAGWYRYFELSLNDFPVMRERVMQGVVGHRGGVDGTILSRELGLGYLPVATILRQLDEEGLLRISKPESSAGVYVMSVLPRLMRALK